MKVREDEIELDVGPQDDVVKMQRVRLYVVGREREGERGREREREGGRGRDREVATTAGMGWSEQRGTVRLFSDGWPRNEEAMRSRSSIWHVSHGIRHGSGRRSCNGSRVSRSLLGWWWR
jgi:hypothetical protein